jgi:hypothetical protein
MAFDPSTLTDYSWSEIKIAAKAAMVSAAMGGANYTIRGRQLGRITIKEATALYDFATQMEADEASGSSGGLALVRFGERV